MESLVEIEANQVIHDLHGDRGSNYLNEAYDQLNLIQDKHQTELNAVYGRYLDGRIAFRTDDFEGAIAIFKNILEASDINSYRAIYFYTCVYLAITHAMISKYHLSQQYFAKADNVIEQGEYALELLLNANRAGIYIVLEDYEQGYTYSEKARDAGSKVDVPTTYSIALANLGICQMHLNKLDEAIETLDFAIDHTAKHKMKYENASAQFYKALVLTKLNRLSEAAQLYKYIYEFTKDGASLLLQLEFAQAYSKFLFDTKNYDLATKFCHQMLNSPGFESNHKLRAGLYEVLTASYRKLNDEQNELLYLRTLKEEQAKVIEKNRQDQSDYIELSYDSTKKDAELEQTKSLLDQIQSFTKLGQLIAGLGDGREDVFALWQKVQDIVPCTSCSLAIYREHEHILEYKYLIDDGHFQEPFVVDCNGQSRIGVYCVKNKTPIKLETSSAEEVAPYLDEPYSIDDIWVSDQNTMPSATSVICVPVLLRDKLLGVLSVQQNKSYAYNDVHVQMVEQVASYIAVSISNVQQKMELAEHHEYMELIYHTDPLTGLKNRYGLSHHLKTLQDSDDDVRELTGIFIDVDCMKLYNESYGASKGDQVLISIAETIIDSVEYPESVYRIGGDEFLVMLKDVDSCRSLRVAECIQAQLANKSVPHNASTVSHKVTTTIGIFTSPAASMNEQFAAKMLASERGIIGAKKKQRNAIFKYHSQ